MEEGSLQCGKQVMVHHLQPGDGTRGCGDHRGSSRHGACRSVALQVKRAGFVSRAWVRSAPKALKTARGRVTACRIFWPYAFCKQWWCDAGAEQGDVAGTWGGMD